MFVFRLIFMAGHQNLILADRINVFLTLLPEAMVNFYFDFWQHLYDTLDGLFFHMLANCI